MPIYNYYMTTNLRSSYICILFVCHCRVLSICRHNGFCAITFILDDQGFWILNTMNHGTELKLVMIWGTVALPVFERDPKVQKWVFLFFVCTYFSVHLILMSFVHEFIYRKIPFRKMHITLSCNYHPTIFTKKGEIQIF